MSDAIALLSLSLDDIAKQRQTEKRAAAVKKNPVIKPKVKVSAGLRKRGTGQAAARARPQTAGAGPMRTRAAARQTRRTAAAPYSSSARVGKTSSIMSRLGGKVSEGGYNVFVSNLNYDVLDSDVEELFGAVGTLSGCVMHYDSAGRTLGKATVTYSKFTDAEEAVRRFHRRTLDDTPMEVKLEAKAGGRPVKAAAPSSARAGRGVSGGAGGPAGGFGQHDDRFAKARGEPNVRDGLFGTALNGGGRDSGGDKWEHDMYESGGGGGGGGRGRRTYSRGRGRGRGRGGGRGRSRGGRVAAPANEADLDAAMDSYMEG